MPLVDVPGYARRVEALGFDGLMVPEAVNDGVLVSLLALEHTERLHVATGVVVAFARSPMLLAQDAWGLQRLSKGRFELGLGSQVRRNIEQRFGMPWSAPAARMRDYVGALRAIFECWQNGTELAYQSESYHLSRMQPFFDPGPLETPQIPILLGAVGPKMTRVAGEVAERVIAHPTHSEPSYLREVTRPALAEGARAAGRTPGAVGMVANPITATGATAQEIAAEREQARRILSFTYSTPAYGASLAHHGWQEVGQRLRRCARRGDWASMHRLVTDEMLDVLVPAGSFDGIAELLLERYAGVADALILRMPSDPGQDEDFGVVVEALHKG